MRQVISAFGLNCSCRHAKRGIGMAPEVPRIIAPGKAAPSGRRPGLSAQSIPSLPSEARRAARVSFLHILCTRHSVTSALPSGKKLLTSVPWTANVQPSRLHSHKRFNETGRIHSALAPTTASKPLSRFGTFMRLQPPLAPVSAFPLSRFPL